MYHHSYTHTRSRLYTCAFQVSNLKKQLGEKDRVILEKEKKIGELQGDLWKKDREFRVKLQQAQKENAAEVESLQVQQHILYTYSTSLCVQTHTYVYW